MKRNFQRAPTRKVLLILVFAISAASCKKTGGAGASTQTLQQYLSSTSQYTLFNKALRRTGLDTLLGGAAPYTVFAVSDSSMNQSGYTSAGIDTINLQRLRGVLLYQLVPGSITGAALQYYQEIPFTTADSGYQAYLENNNFGLFYNGIPVTGEDSSLTNGIVQRLQTIAAPPAGDLYTTIGTVPMLSDYNILIHNVGQYGGPGDYLKTATTASPLTVFLPDNTWFAEAGEDAPAILQSANNFFYFWGNGQYYTSDFLGAADIYLSTDQFGDNNYLWFSNDGYSFHPAYYYSGNNPPLSVNSTARYRIVRGNIVATNGVIHIIQPY